MLINPRRKFVLHTNSKCGGTTLRLWFFDTLGLFENRLNPFTEFSLYGPALYARFLTRPSLTLAILRDGHDLPSTDVRLLSRSYEKHVSSRFRATAERERWPSILVTRDPASRLVSAFYDKFCGEDVNKPWVREVVHAASRGETITFNQFLDWLSTADLDNVNPHWIRQSRIVDRHRIDHLIKLEEINERFNELVPLTGGKRDFFLDNRRQQSPTSKGGAGAQITPDTPNTEIIAFHREHGVHPGKKVLLTPDTASRIAKIYARDYAALGYTAG